MQVILLHAYYLKNRKKLESYYKWRHNVYIINKYKLLDIIIANFKNIMAVNFSIKVYCS